MPDGDGARHEIVAAETVSMQANGACKYIDKGVLIMRSITTLDLQYAHRFYGFQGEAQYLHGHTGVLTIEVEDSIEPGVNLSLIHI